jgi:hypothetical protein
MVNIIVNAGVPNSFSEASVPVLTGAAAISPPSEFPIFATTQGVAHVPARLALASLIFGAQAHRDQRRREGSELQCRLKQATR